MHKSQSCLKGKVMDLEVHKRNIFDNFFTYFAACVCSDYENLGATDGP